MTDGTAAFFDELAKRGHEPRLARATGVVRLEVGKGAKARVWHVEFQKGDIVVAPGRGPADCTLRADEQTLEDIVSGRISPVTALLRGQIELEGDTRLLVLFRRLRPGPAPTRTSKRRKKK
ncbi:MAG: SCP2 sterol-binding domain-containing protein [Gaiellaceae bacterium]